MKVEELASMLGVVEHLYYWRCDKFGRLEETTIAGGVESSEARMLFTLFERSDFMEKIKDHGRHSDVPYALGMYMGLVWFVIQGTEDGRIHLLGPVFFSPVSEAQMEGFLMEYETQGMGFKSRHALLKILMGLPVVFQKYFGYFALMLDRVVNHRELSYEDIDFLVDKLVDEDRETAPQLYYSSHIFMEEMLGHIRLGDKGALEGMGLDKAMGYTMLPTHAAGITTPLRALRDCALIFTARCAAAAVDGGVSPEIAYALADIYMGTIEKDRSGMELMELMGQIYEEYLLRVWRQKHQNESYSSHVQSCLDYIDLHIKEKIDVSALAEMTGYTTYYLSRIFYRETGEHLPDCIRRKKIEYAGMLLESTDMEVNRIAENLSFCSASHFSDVFRRLMGMSPSEYRMRDHGQQREKLL